MRFSAWSDLLQCSLVNVFYWHVKPSFRAVFGTFRAAPEQFLNPFAEHFASNIRALSAPLQLVIKAHFQSCSRAIYKQNRRIYWSIFRWPFQSSSRAIPKPIFRAFCEQYQTLCAFITTSIGNQSAFSEQYPSSFRAFLEHHNSIESQNSAKKEISINKIETLKTNDSQKKIDWQTLAK